MSSSTTKRSSLIRRVGLLSLLLLQGCGSGPGDTGKTCVEDADCEGDLICELHPGATMSQCSLHCSGSDECEDAIGGGVFCIGGNLCVRECSRKNDDCPENTACDPTYDWCVAGG